MDRMKDIGYSESREREREMSREKKKKENEANVQVYLFSIVFLVVESRVRKKKIQMM